MPIQRGSLLLSAQQALVGNIGKSVLAVSISAVDDHIRMIAWRVGGCDHEKTKNSRRFDNILLLDGNRI